MELIEVILVVIYIILFSIIISKTKLFSDSGLKSSFIISVFLIKIAMCYLYAYIHYKRGWGDTYDFFDSAKIIYNLLPNHPVHYLQLVFTPVPEPFSPQLAGELGQDRISGYGVMRNDFIIRVQSFIMMFSFGYYSVQCVLFEFLSLIGIIYIYNFIQNIFTENLKFVKYFIFFAPSLLFWLSGMHKEVLVLSSLAGLFYSVHQIFERKRAIFWLLIPIFLCTLFFSRDYVFLLFFPAFLAYLISRSSKIAPFWPYLMVYGVAAVVFLLDYFTVNQLRFFQRIIETQEQFIQLNSTSEFQPVHLEPTLLSFIKAAPIAFYKAIAHPNLFDKHSGLYAIGALENTIYLLIGGFILFQINYKDFSRTQKSTLMLFLLFSISYLILLGLIVSNSGALSRYKATPLLFLGSALLLLYNHKKFTQLIKKIQNEN